MKRRSSALGCLGTGEQCDRPNCQKCNGAESTAIELFRSDMEAVRALDELDVSDPEQAHLEADRVLLRRVHPEVAAAYERVTARARWWAWA